MLFADFKNKTARTNLLSKVDVLGSFDFFTSLISLDALSADDITEIRTAFGMKPPLCGAQNIHLSPSQYSIATKVLTLATHEYTHFVDATSTLWGLRHLELMNSAYCCNDRRGTKEALFFKAKEFYDYSRRIRLPDYYTVVNDKITNTRPWQSNISIGNLFSGSGTPTDRSVLFSRFSNSNGLLLARSPISTVSLLEASAMAQELLLHAWLLQNTEPGFRLVEQQLFNKQTLNYLYNPSITEYSVCAHVVANQQGCTNVFAAFRMCSIMTRLVLNFPDSAFDRIAESCPISALLEIPKDHPSEAAVRNGIRNKDHGTVFYLLCSALPPHSHTDDATFIKGLESALLQLGIDLCTLLKDSNEAAVLIYNDIANSDVTAISTLAKAGFANYKSIDPQKCGLDFQRLNVPPALLGDSSIAQLFNSPTNMLQNFDLESCFEELFHGQSWVERFSEACV